MSMELNLKDVEKFATTSGTVNEVVEKLESLNLSSELVIDVEKEIVKGHNDNGNIIMMDNGDTVSVMFRSNAYVESFDNPLDPDSDYLNLKSFKNLNDREDYVEKNKASSFYLVDKYSHGADHYSIASTVSYPDARWDVSYGCAAIELGQDAIGLRKAYVAKYGKEEGGEKFVKYLNDTLDRYSNYVNGHGETYKFIEIDKAGGDCEVNYGPTFFSSDELEKDLANTIYSKLTKDLRSKVESATTTSKEVTAEDLKGFSNNVMRKGSTEMEVVKYTNDDGIEHKMLLVSFPDKVVAYTTSNANGDEIEDKLERKLTYGTVESERNYLKGAFNRQNSLNEFVESIQGFKIEEVAPKTPKIRM